MQVMYQFDLRGVDDADAIREGLIDGYDDAETLDAACVLARVAWEDRDVADRMTTEVAPQWPSHRQPPVDRAILRLALHEIMSGRTPDKVAINEAVELAKKFGGEQSPNFVNGVLDKIAKNRRNAQADSAAS